MKEVLKVILIGMFIAGFILFISETNETAPLMEQVWLWLKGLGLMAVSVGIGIAVDEKEEQA